MTDAQAKRKILARLRHRHYRMQKEAKKMAAAAERIIAQTVEGFMFPIDTPQHREYIRCLSEQIRIEDDDVHPDGR